MIYIFYMDLGIYTFFYGMFMRMSMNNLNSSTNWTFQAGWRVDLTNTANSSIAHTPRKKGNKIKRRRELERQDRMSRKSKFGGKKNLKL